MEEEEKVTTTSWATTPISPASIMASIRKMRQRMLGRRSVPSAIVCTRVQFDRLCLNYPGMPSPEVTAAIANRIPCSLFGVPVYVSQTPEEAMSLAANLVREGNGRWRVILLRHGEGEGASLLNDPALAAAEDKDLIMRGYIHACP